ncbi:hypothetical protein BSKO_11991 [Bryopsis sp. KO-2023]|nr:hypothetical protein BSKO_11991 [Bryopsis sp. KO-2023]
MVNTSFTPRALASPDIGAGSSRTLRSRFVRVRAVGGSSGGIGGSGGGRGWGGDDGGSEDNGPSIRYGLPILGAAALLINPPSAGAQEEVSGTVDALWDTYGPTITTLGFSGLVGVACAGALKVVGKSVAFTIGLLFVAIQLLKSSGMIEVNWGKVQNKLGTKFDVTGDKKFDDKDVKTLMTRFLNVVSDGIPSVGGFMAGFVLGIKVL